MNDYDAVCVSGETYGPVDPEKIQSAERRLGVRFPDSYRTFLAEYGALLGDGVEIYGLPEQDEDACPVWQSVVDVTLRLRAASQDGALSGEMFPISEDGTGVYFFINSGEHPKTEIHAIGPGVNRILEYDFKAFVVAVSRGDLIF